MRKALRTNLFVRAYTTATVVLVLLFAAMYAMSVPFIQSSIETAEERAAKTLLNSVVESVEEAHRDLDNRRDALLQARKAELRSIIDVVGSRVAWLEARVGAGSISRDRARDMLLDELRQIKYGNNDYVWASNYHSVLVSHPDPKLNNADFSAVRDVHGNFIVPPMVEGAVARGDGFHSYWWRRLGREKPVEKLSYYRHFPGFKLVIGTGIYVDDIEDAHGRDRENVIINLRQLLRNTRIANTGYLYVFDGTPRMIIHPNANIEGKPVADVLQPGTQQLFFPALMAVADKPDGLRYKWDSPDDPGNYSYPKISWVRYSAKAGWYIGSSIYLDELNESARILGNRVLAIFFATLAATLFLVYIFVQRLTSPLRHVGAVARRVGEGDLAARCDLRREDEIGVVAAAFDGMVDRLRDNIDHLDARVRERTTELEKANQELKELDRLKSDFLSTVSHELRTPMTSVIGFSRLTRKKLEEAILPRLADEPKARQATTQAMSNLDIIIQESERLTLLINDVLDSAKLEAGKVDWQFSPQAPDILIDQAMDIIAPMFDQADRKLVRSIEPGLPKVMADADRIRQVLINLISNAIKFSHEKDIELLAARQEKFVRFSVRDNGIGIAREHQEAVFDKFRQLSDTLTDKAHGTGLGLSICRQIVEGHGGRIWVESEPGQGSTFNFTLPMAPLPVETPQS